MRDVRGKGRRNGPWPACGSICGTPRRKPRRCAPRLRGFLAEAGQGLAADGAGLFLDGLRLDFSREVGKRGWIGMTWPKAYGGGERTALERYVVLEEMLAVGAPVGAHWIGDRQSGPLILRLGTEEQRREFLPRIVSGDLAFAIGLSEPDSGSDLASLRTKAEKVPGGWKINGRKVWTTNAHRCDFMIALLRTAPAPDPKARHQGLSQFLVDCRQLRHHHPADPRPGGGGGVQRDHLRRRLRPRQHAGRPGRQWLGTGDRRAGLRTCRAGAVLVLVAAADGGAGRCGPNPPRPRPWAASSPAPGHYAKCRWRWRGCCRTARPRRARRRS